MSVKPKILIVDDEPSARDTLEALLYLENYDLAFASDGPEALAKAAELTPDLILLDVMMPDMDGFEVCQRLRADPLLAEAPVIMVTALDDQDSRLRGIEVGADDFVSKPFNRVELRARVRTITRLNRYRRLLTERAKFEWVVEQASDGYLMIDDDDRLLYANLQARLYLSLPPDQNEPISGTFLEWANKQYRCESRVAWATWPAEASESSPAAQSSRYLVQPETPNARAFWLQVDTQVLPSGTEAGQIVRLRDVTTQRALQRDMRGFHSMVSHKLRTPLAIVLGSLEVLSMFGPQLSDEELVESATGGIKNARRLESEIQDILAYLDAPGRPESGEGFCLARLEPVLAEIGSNLKIKSIKAVCPEDLKNLRVLLSQRAIELVLWEILENAKKFHPQQSPVVEALVSRANSKEIRFQIRDNGLTLSPEHLGQVWTPYYQGEKHFTGQAPGMGLGLAMVASLVWGVGGTSHAYNREDGPGVVVEFTVPLE